MNGLKNLHLGLIALLLLLPLGAAHSAPLSQRDDVALFIDKMVESHGFEKKALNAIFDKVKLQKRVEKAIASPAEAKPWYKYRSIFLKKSRIEGGVKFWQEHADVLAETEKRFGVPAEIITAIIGVETRYASNTGGFRVIDSLSTLAFNYPKRSRFFTKELEQFLLLCREENFNPLELTGSYAGAMGVPQFMPSSFRHYAADFEQDGRKDIWGNTADVIASVANYFTVHGWKQGEPVAFKVAPENEQFKQVVDNGLKIKTTLADLEAAGVQLENQNLPPETAARLLSLRQKKGTEEWIVLHNFYVITRYNHSNLYAMAVLQLSREIRNHFLKVASN